MRPSFAVSTSVRRADPYALLPPRPSGVGSSLLMLEAGSEVIGRATEQARLKAFAEGVSEGPTAMLLAGAAGMGKTTLWRFGIEMARVRGYRVLATRPSVAEARSGFAALRDLLGDVVGDVLDDVPGPQADALRIALLLKRPDGTHLDQSVVAASCVGSTAPWWRSPGRWPPGSDRRRVHRPRGRSTARLLGTQVTVIEAAPVPLAAILGTPLGAWFAQLHREEGVETHTSLRTLGLGVAAVTSSNPDSGTPSRRSRNSCRCSLGDESRERSGHAHRASSELRPQIQGAQHLVGLRRT